MIVGLKKKLSMSFMPLPWGWTQPGMLIGNYCLIKNPKLQNQDEIRIGH